MMLWPTQRENGLVSRKKIFANIILQFKKQLFFLQIKFHPASSKQRFF